jgi:hypothetical protein
METIDIKLIPTENILIILPLLKELNSYTDENILKDRILDMSNSPNYKCVGVYMNTKLIGISGLWFLTRHYCGKTIEPDHVVIASEFRSKGISKILFEWIYNYTKNIGYEATELNTYIENTKSHQFYENEGFKKLGYHYLKKI